MKKIEEVNNNGLAILQATTHTRALSPQRTKTLNEKKREAIASAKPNETASAATKRTTGQQ